MVSLFPVDTWKGRPNGLRKDLVQLLYDMHPGFLRFPGGCIVEGRELVTRYRWKTTVGDIAERKTIINRWNDEFDHAPCARLLPVLRPRLLRILPARRRHRRQAPAHPQLRHGLPVQLQRNRRARASSTNTFSDALDLIEFANGPVTSPWGKLRAQMGHPAPFHLDHDRRRQRAVGNPLRRSLQDLRRRS